MRPSRKPAEVQGVVPVIPIPFGEDESIDEQALRREIDFAAACGVSAICLPAYGSEFYKLSEEERYRVVSIAVEQGAGRLLVIAQSNHVSSRVALSLARANVSAGADLISIAIPRVFALPNDDLLRFLETILNGVDVPFLIQDFNPGGVTMGTDFARSLWDRCPNFRYVKLEEVLLASKVMAIRHATDDRVGVLEGWGGLYLMELIPAGICGCMPGLGMADLLNYVFSLRKAGKSAEAVDLFSMVLPQIVFSLQNLELYLYCEKRLLQSRGVVPNTLCRQAAYTPDALTARYVDELTERVLRAITLLPASEQATII
jgi:4-hydroxy-tetrahydrodipicolinate synthase